MRQLSRFQLSRILPLLLLACLGGCSSSQPGLDGGASHDSTSADLHSKLDGGALERSTSELALREQGSPRDTANTDYDFGKRDAAYDAQTPEDLLPDQASDMAAGPLSLRIVAANLTSGNLQSYDEGHGARILKGLQPDVVLIQEFNFGDNSEAAIRSFVNETFGAGYFYVRGAGRLPNGIVSRYPISTGGEWVDTEASNRDFSWAKIALPGGRTLWALSLHLLSGATSTSRRHLESNELLQHLQQNIPADALLVVGGDFNTENRNEGCITALKGRLVTLAPYPADALGNEDTNRSRTRPYDWLLVSHELSQASAPLVIGANSFPSGLVFDSRIYQPLADLPGVLPDDSDANQMQHMAVVRQFGWP